MPKPSRNKKELPCSDAQLVKRCSEHRDKKAFEILYEKYFPLALGTAIKYTKDQETSQEIVATVFATLWEKMPHTHIRAFNAYLHSMTRNECMAYLRRQQSERSLKKNYPKSDFYGQEFMENEGYQRLLNAGISIEDALHKAIQNLSERQRTCIDLFYFQKKTYKEISALTGFTLKEVKSYLQNGKRNLRIAMEHIFRQLNL